MSLNYNQGYDFLPNNVKTFDLWKKDNKIMEGVNDCRTE